MNKSTIGFKLQGFIHMKGVIGTLQIEKCPKIQLHPHVFICKHRQQGCPYNKNNQPAIYHNSQLGTIKCEIHTPIFVLKNIYIYTYI